MELAFEPSAIRIGEWDQNHYFVLIGGKKGHLVIHNPDKDKFISFGSQLYHKKAVNAIAQINDFIVSAGEDKQVLVWNLQDR